jgi:hypothetical protein
MHTDVRVPLNGPPGHGADLSDDSMRFLSALKDWCEAQGVRVAYSLPWGYTPVRRVEGFRQEDARILVQIPQFIPVLNDPLLGADLNAGHFADAAWHLNEEGSRLRTHELGRSVKQWDFWSVKELQRVGGVGFRPE